MNYFAYGPHISQEEMQQKQIQYLFRVGAILKGYQLVFNKIYTQNPSEGKQNLQISSNGQVQGVFYEIPTYEVKKLDTSYGYPIHYSRIKVQVTLRTGEIRDAITYIAQTEMIGEKLLPKKTVIETMLKATDILSPEYINYLKSLLKKD